MKTDPQTATDAEVVKAVLAGDRSAYVLLVRRYEKTVHTIAVGILGDFDAARDTTQDAFVGAYEKLGSLRNQSRFGGLWSHEYSFAGTIHDVSIHCRPLAPNDGRTLFESDGIISDA